jgi:hypothetical protein
MPDLMLAVASGSRGELAPSSTTDRITNSSALLRRACAAMPDGEQRQAAGLRLSTASKASPARVKTRG